MSHISRIFLLILVVTGLLLQPVAAADSMPAPPLPNVHILATGGTIAGISKESTDMIHYQPGNLGVESLISSVPEVYRYAHVTGEQVCNINSDDITPEIWLNLSSRINTLLSDPAVDGIVVTHGTDTLEETAYFLNLVIHSEKPVVITGAMRPATAISADGPLNLLHAVQLAGSPDARGAGVMILLNGEINSARETTKMNTGSVETFRSPDFGLLGYMADGQPPRIVCRHAPTLSDQSSM
jgi:L-asparaginase